MAAKRTDRPQTWKERYIGDRIGLLIGWCICLLGAHVRACACMHACMHVAADGLESGSFQL